MKKFLRDNKIKGQHFIFKQSCHSVAEAATAVNASPREIVKSICMIDGGGNLIVAFVRGEDRVSALWVGKALHIKPPRKATPREILEKTGYPCGGVPPFGYRAKFLIDPKVIETDTVYAGGGSENSLIKISTKELQEVNQGKVIRVRE